MADWRRWLIDEQEKSYNCKDLLPDPGSEVVEQWAKWFCEEREKLARARGIIYSIKFGRKVTAEEIDEVLEYTKG
jgi:hypothetical protein